MNLKKRQYLSIKYQKIINKTIAGTPHDRKKHQLTNYFQKCEVPWKNVRISIITFSQDSVKFNELLQSLVQTCSNPEFVEIIVKFDTEINYKPFKKILVHCPFQHKMLSYSKFNTHFQQHYIMNDLCRLANGDIVWVCSDNIKIVDGDWLKALLDTRGFNSDNIYCAHFTDASEDVWSYAITQEWIDVVQHLTDHLDVDRWVIAASEALKRKTIIDNINVDKTEKEKFDFGPDTLFEEKLNEQLTRFRELVK